MEDIELDHVRVYQRFIPYYLGILTGYFLYDYKPKHSKVSDFQINTIIKIAMSLDPPSQTI